MNDFTVPLPRSFRNPIPTAQNSIRQGAQSLRCILRGKSNVALPIPVNDKDILLCKFPDHLIQGRPSILKFVPPVARTGSGTAPTTFRPGTGLCFKINSHPIKRIGSRKTSIAWRQLPTSLHSRQKTRDRIIQFTIQHLIFDLPLVAIKRHQQGRDDTRQKQEIPKLDPPANRLRKNPHLD